MFTLRKSLAFALAAIMLISGCGGKKETGPQTNPDGQAAKKDPVVIDFWHGMQPGTAHGDTLSALVKRFNESQSEVRVNETHKGNYSTLQTSFVGAVQAGDPPALIQATDSMVTGLVNNKVLQDLSSLIPAAERADYPDSLFEALIFDEKPYAMPFNKSIVVMIYDKAVVPTPPTTWEEFEKVAKQVTTRERYGTVFETSVYYFGNLMVQAGGTWTKDRSHSQVAFNSEAGVKALEMIVRMAKEGHGTQLKPNEFQSNYFNEGRAAMVLTTSASFAFINPANNNPWGVAELPKGPANNLTGLSGANLAMSAGLKPEVQEAAMKFMLFLTGKEATLAFAQAKTGYLPVRKSAVASAEWKAFVQANPEYAVLASAMEKGTVHPNHKEWSNVQKLVATAVEEAVLGKATPKDALDKAAKSANELLAKK